MHKSINVPRRGRKDGLPAVTAAPQQSLGLDIFRAAREADEQRAKTATHAAANARANQRMTEADAALAAALSNSERDIVQKQAAADAEAAADPGVGEFSSHGNDLNGYMWEGIEALMAQRAALKVVAQR